MKSQQMAGGEGNGMMVVGIMKMSDQKRRGHPVWNDHMAQHEVVMMDMMIVAVRMVDGGVEMKEEGGQEEKIVVDTEMSAEIEMMTTGVVMIVLVICPHHSRGVMRLDLML